MTNKTTKILLRAALLATTIAGMAAAADAATCADRTHVVGQLEARFGETLHAVSEMRQNAVLEVYASGQTESWTVTVSLPRRGLSCIVASGHGFTELQDRYQHAVFLGS